MSSLILEFCFLHIPLHIRGAHRQHSSRVCFPQGCMGVKGTWEQANCKLATLKVFEEEPSKELPTATQESVPSWDRPRVLCSLLKSVSFLWSSSLGATCSCYQRLNKLKSLNSSLKTSYYLSYITYNCHIIFLSVMFQTIWVWNPLQGQTESHISRHLPTHTHHLARQINAKSSQKRSGVLLSHVHCAERSTLQLYSSITSTPFLHKYS